MIQNYFKTAFRSLWRNRQFSLINIAGLALGIAVFLFIMQYVVFEWNANRFNTNYASLYRTHVMYKEGNTDFVLPSGFAPVIKQQFPAIENYTRVANDIANGVIAYNDGNTIAAKTFRDDKILYVDGNFFSLFSFPILSGNASLAQPKTLALSETMSRKLFGTADAVGKTVTVSNQFGNTLYTVKAVYAQPEASDIQADVLLSLETLASPANRDGNDWADPAGTSSGFTSIYLKLRNDVNATALASSITKYLRSINPDSKSDVVYLQPFSEMHLAPSFSYPYQTFGNLLMVVVFACVAVLILLIAWVNYINLSIAQALNRTKEVGVRKVLGASRMQLAVQYLTETFLLTLASAGIAVLLVTLFQNLFNEVTGREYSLAVLNVNWFWVSGIVIVFIGSLLAGSYVSFALTSFSPVNTLRRKGSVAVKGFSLRKGLVVFQFTISIVLIIATVIIYKQLQYMKTENLGMNLNQLLVMSGPTVASEDQAAKNAAFKDALSQLPFVKKQAASNNVPGVGYCFSANGFTGTDVQKDDDRKEYSMFISDNNFFDTWGIPFAQGGTFSRNDAERSWNNVKKVIINEKAALALHYNPKENLVGKKLFWGKELYEIIGVVKDYHHLSLREAIKPVIYLGSVSYSYFTIQTDARDMSSKISTLKNLYNKFFPGNPFDYFFADERYNQQYQAEQKLGNLFIAAASIAIFIACLGLFGLVAFSARQRVREIGIRKVLGAGVRDITSLLSKDFIKLVLVSIIIASPIAWWAMHSWLQDFAYRTNIDWWIFLLAGFIAIAIALCTVGFQGIKAALANPVKSLRTE